MSFLYPMLDGTEHDAPALLADLARSVQAKARESSALRSATLASLADQLSTVTAAMAQAFSRGGRLFCFGNGGSATDAAGLAALFCAPPYGRALPARSLVADVAVLTALANDIGVDVLFSRQIIAHGREGDIALGLSTSGGSTNVLKAFGEARRRGLLTIGLAGHRGGAMSSCADLDHCLGVDGQSVHRTQETQSALAHELWVRVQRRLDAQERR